MLTGITPLVVGTGLKTGLNILIDNPAQLGSDLVVGGVAALAKYKPPIIIFDMGTATTISVIDEKSNYLGGAIVPGMQLSLSALVSGTSQLPKVPLESQMCIRDRCYAYWKRRRLFRLRRKICKFNVVKGRCVVPVQIYTGRRFRACFWCGKELH